MMSELPDEDPRMEDFYDRIANGIKAFVGKSLSEATIYFLGKRIEHERTRFKQTYGHEVPKVVLLILPSSRYISIFRADLESPQIQVVVVNMLRELSAMKVPVDIRELSVAIKKAWPQYDPSLVIDMAALDKQASPSLRH